MEWRQVVWLGVLAGLVAACGGDDGAGPPKGGRVSLDASAAVHDSVTAAGKVLTTTSHGVSYTLTIPAGAVKVPTAITMTPVTGISSIHVTSLIGAVDLQPQGLVLGRPAQLRIASPLTGPPAGNLTLGFNYEGDADTLHLLLPRDSAGSVTLSIRHFSGAVAAFATQEMIEQFINANASDPSQVFIDSLFRLQIRVTRDFEAEQGTMRAWFNTVLLPGIGNVANELDLLRVMSDYNAWRTTDLPPNLVVDDPRFASERTQFAAAAVSRLQAAIAADNAVCASAHDPAFANNALFWQTVAQALGVATSDNALDRPGVLARLCVQVLITDSSYPDPVQANQTASLDLLAGLKFGNDPALATEHFAWRLDITGSTADGVVQGLSASDGSFTRVIAPTGQGPLVVAISACLDIPQVPYDDVCAGGNLVRNFSCAIVRAGDLRIADSVDVAQARDIREIQGVLTIANGAELVMNFPCLRKVAQLNTENAGPGILNLTVLDSVRAIATGGTGVLDIRSTNLRFVNLPALTHAQRVSFVGNPRLSTIVLGAPHILETLAIANDRSLTELTIGAAHIDQTVSIGTDSALTSLGHISSGILIGESLFIQGNPLLTTGETDAFLARIQRPPSVQICCNAP